jgi:hypothetical protein
MHPFMPVLLDCKAGKAHRTVEAEQVRVHPHRTLDGRELRCESDREPSK